MSHSIGFYSSHDSSLTIKISENEFRIYEFERLLKKRYCNLNHEENYREILLEIKKLIWEEYGIDNFGSCFFAQMPADKRVIFQDVFNCIHYEEISHHAAHAAGALYQSPFRKALIISSDSGGHEIEDGVQTFCLFLGDKAEPMNHVIKKLANIPLDAAGAYTLLAVPLAEINKDDFLSRYLSYAGKLMGLAGYGNVWHDWLEPMRRYFYQPVNLDSLAKLGEEIGFDFSAINTVSGQPSYDIAATAQFVFEEVSKSAMMPFIEKYRLPVILTGGAALNVLLNERLRKQIDYPLFVPVNPSDCGLSLGMLCLREPPPYTISVAYSGTGILDIKNLSGFIEKYNAKKVNHKVLARKICEGRIIAVMQGNSEAGPRALGNRSILCWPGDKELKHKINVLKQREEYRPFAPVVRQEDASLYFQFETASPFMSYAPYVRPEYIESIPAIVHKDGTSRLQTVTKEQNELLYNILTCVDVIKDIGVLLNTSLNIKGKPILTTVADAIEVWLTTELDCLYIEGWLFEK